MGERLTEEQADRLYGLLELSVSVATSQCFLTEAEGDEAQAGWRSLLTEVRERREQDGAARLVCDGYTAAHRERDVLRTRVAELEAALRECVEESDPHGWAELFALGIQAEAFSATEKGDTAAMEKADAITSRARAALAKGGSNG